MSVAGDTAPLLGVDGALPGLWRHKAARLLAIALVVTVLLLIATLVAVAVLAMQPRGVDDSYMLPDKAHCNHKGILSSWSRMCECFECWGGPTCAVEMANCTLDVTVAQAGMFEEYFESLPIDAQRLLSPRAFPSWWQVSFGNRALCVCVCDMVLCTHA